MSISTLRRQVKNVAYNFSDAQVKVREATSNDPWGPTTALMSEIADMTHNPMSFTEIMSMLWKRLNDHGKNWRHVYKSLVLLDYLIKCGSEKVAQQCRENIYSIETLKDFQHIEDNRDQGLNVREKAKQMVSLLNDEERLRNERARFLLTRKRFIQNGSAISSDGTIRSVRRPPDTGVIDLDSEFEEARPSSIGEEEMQLQIAIALSREECEKEVELQKSDDMRLQIALEESKRAAESVETKVPPGSSKNPLDDLLSLGLGDNSILNPQAPSTSSQAYGKNLIDPWSPTTPTTTNHVYPTLNSTTAIPTLAANDPWSVTPSAKPPTGDLLNNDFIATTTTNPLAQNDPWATFETSTNASTDVANNVSTMVPNSPLTSSGNNENLLLNNLSTAEFATAQHQQQGQQRQNVKTPESFLGENSALVNLDNLMGPSNIQSKPASNPFMLGTSIPVSTNPFSAQNTPSPSLHEMMQAQRTGTLHPQPAQTTSPTNPFSL